MATFDYTTFDLNIDNEIAQLRFNQPERRNAMTKAFWDEFPSAIRRISDEALARVIVISSEGEHFSAGMDVSVFMEGALDASADNPHTSAELFLHTVKKLQDAFSVLEHARQPVLCAIQGGAIGGAVDLVTAADCRYATEDSFFCVLETAIGMTADVGTFPRLAKLIPEGWARQMAYTAERLPAHKAKEIGLVNEVYATQEEMLDAVMAIAKEIASHSPLAVSGCKEMINFARDNTTQAALNHIGVWNAGMLRPADIREAYIAKQEKRTPIFDNLRPVGKF